MPATRRVTESHSVRAELIEVGDIIKINTRWVKVTGFGDGMETAMDIEYTYTQNTDITTGKWQSVVYRDSTRFQDFDLVETQIDKIIRDVADDQSVHMEYGGRELGNRV